MTEKNIHHAAGVVAPTSHWNSVLLRSTPTEQCRTLWGRLKRWTMIWILRLAQKLLPNVGDLCCHTHGLMFTQPDIDSLMDRLSTSSKTAGRTNTWVLLDSQSIIDVFYNGKLHTKIHKTNILSESDTMRGWTLQTRGNNYWDMDGYIMVLYWRDSQHLIVYEQDKREIQSHFL